MTFGLNLIKLYGCLTALFAARPLFRLFLFFEYKTILQEINGSSQNSNSLDARAPAQGIFVISTARQGLIMWICTPDSNFWGPLKLGCTSCFQYKAKSYNFKKINMEMTSQFSSCCWNSWPHFFTLIGSPDTFWLIII